MVFPLRLVCAALCATALAAGPGCSDAPAAEEASAEEELTGLERPLPLADDESLLMLLATNDVHGSIDRFPQLGGYVTAARAHLASAYGAERGKLLVLDAGDATQGTLLSNYSEGTSVVKAMNAVGYTAAIAGNHGFDFGPVDWKQDRCATSARSCDPLAALRRLTEAATFPFLGANVAKTEDGKPLDFLPPYVLVPFQGRNVAIIGLENHFTSRTTVPENVASLTFGDGKAELAREVESLFTSGRADVFVVVIHEGDGATANMAFFLAGLPRRSDGAPLVDVAIGGHSHTVNDAVAKEIPYIQSGANGELFGVVQMVLKKDEATGRLSVERERTRKKAAIRIAERPSGFLGERVQPSEEVARIVAEARAEVAPIAERHIVTAPAPVSREGGRIADSEIGNLVADAMRRATGADVAVINGGDIRDDFPAGEIHYDALFRVLPKNLELVVVREMPTAAFVENVRLSIRSCGRRGALQISGVTLTYARDCSRANDGEDRKAELIEIPSIFHVEDGKDVYERPTLAVATTDYVMSGGAGYSHFAGLSPSEASEPLREAVARELSAMRVLDPTSYARGRYEERR